MNNEKELTIFGIFFYLYIIEWHFFLENNDLYGLYSCEKHNGNSQSFLNNVVNLLNILTSTDI